MASSPNHLLPEDVVWDSSTKIRVKVPVPSPGPIPPVYHLEIFAYFATSANSAKDGVMNPATRGAAIHDADFTASVEVVADSGDGAKNYVGLLYRITESLTGDVHLRIVLVFQRPSIYPGLGDIRACAGYEGSLIAGESSPSTVYFVWCPDGVTTGASKVDGTGSYAPSLLERLWGEDPEITLIPDNWMAVFNKSVPVIHGNSFLYSAGAPLEYFLMVTDLSSAANTKRYRLASVGVSSFTGLYGGEWYTTGTSNGPNGMTIPSAVLSLPVTWTIPYEKTWSGFA